ncbi:protein Aster-B isoform X16 [Suricata suricatta]|uniref:protein Aster-B isoform X16 n=1 Tax=Suricata suricatta TaxID=37032 RepID=UPI00115674C9|nr:protein Aster-B isoform X16 [Suricata suricatta]
MPAANMLESRHPPALQVPEPQGAPEGSPLWSSSSTPTLRRRRFKMRRMKNVREQSLEAGLARDLPGVLAPGKEFLQLPSIEITPSSDEDTPWSNCSTPSASPRRKRFLLRKWLRVRERKECSESSSQQSSQQSSHDDDSSRFLSPRAREESRGSPGRPALASWEEAPGKGRRPLTQPDAKQRSWSRLIWRQQREPEWMRDLRKPSLQAPTPTPLCRRRLSPWTALPVTQTAARRPAPPSSGNGLARQPRRARTETPWWRRAQTTPRTSPRPRQNRASSAAAPRSPAGVAAKIPSLTSASQK